MVQKWTKEILKQQKKTEKKWKILNVNFGLTQVEKQAVKKQIKFSKLTKIRKYCCHITKLELRFI